MRILSWLGEPVPAKVFYGLWHGNAVGTEVVMKRWQILLLHIVTRLAISTILVLVLVYTF